MRMGVPMWTRTASPLMTLCWMSVPSQPTQPVTTLGKEQELKQSSALRGWKLTVCKASGNEPHHLEAPQHQHHLVASVTLRWPARMEQCSRWLSSWNSWWSSLKQPTRCCQRGRNQNPRSDCVWQKQRYLSFVFYLLKLYIKEWRGNTHPCYRRCQWQCSR